MSHWVDSVGTCFDNGDRDGLWKPFSIAVMVGWVVGVPKGPPAVRRYDAYRRCARTIIGSSECANWYTNQNMGRNEGWMHAAPN